MNEPDHKPRSLLVRGGHRLEGEIALAGAKNSALKLMAASLLAAEPSTIRRVPRIADVFTMIDMLRALGAQVTFDDGELRIDPSGALNDRAPYELVRRMRASIIVMGPMVARLGRATIAMPGGCNIGPRRIDFHIRGLEKLGAADRDRARLHRGHKRRPARRHGAARLPERGGDREPAHGGHRGRGHDRHRERRARARDRRPRQVPHVDGRAHPRRRHELDRDRGRPRAARRHPRGRRRPHRGRHLPAGRRGHRRRRHRARPQPGLPRAVPATSCAPWACRSTRATATIRARARGALRPVDVSTLPHPGFATDLQAQFMVALSLADGHLDRHRERLREPLRRGRRAQPPGRRHHHERPSRRGHRARASSPAASSRRPTCAAAPRSPSPASWPRA